MAELTYGGYPLLFDSEQNIGDFLERHQDLDDLRHVTESINRVGSRKDGLTWPNYPPLPDIRLNQLYWPTGASRWSIGYFLASTAQTELITEAAFPTSGTNTSLELKVTSNNTFTAQMFLLTPRKVSCVDDGNNLWLLPLVDERYYWQDRNVGDFEVVTESGSSTTWAELVSQLASQLGITITTEDAADSKYLTPDATELTRRFDNAAVMLDAVAHSTGRRLVRWPDGTIRLTNWSTAADQLTVNIAAHTPWTQIAGGDLDYGPVPAIVRIVARAYDNGTIQPGQTFDYSEAAGLHLTDPVTTADTEHTIHTTAQANWPLDSSGSPIAPQPENDVNLDNLAEQIASDYYDSTIIAYDRTFNGIKIWEPGGYDDHILYQFGGEFGRPDLSAVTSISKDNSGTTATTTLKRDYQRQAWTRVQSPPHNAATEWQLSQDDSEFVDATSFAFWTAKGTSDTSLGSTTIGDAVVVALDDVIDSSGNIWVWSDANDTIQVTEAGIFTFTLSGMFEFATASAQSIWVFLQEDLGGGFVGVERSLRGFEHSSGMGDSHSYMHSITHRVTAGATYRVMGFASAANGTIVSDSLNPIFFPYQENSLDIVKENWK